MRSGINLVKKATGFHMRLEKSSRSIYVQGERKKERERVETRKL